MSKKGKKYSAYGLGHPGLWRLRCIIEEDAVGGLL